MATGLSPYLANLWLDNTFSTREAFVQLHIGDPAAIGLMNQAAGVDRKACKFSPAILGSVVSVTELVWSGMASGDVVYWSLWDSLIGGNFLLSGSVVSQDFVAGNDYRFRAGALQASLTVVK